MIAGRVQVEAGITIEFVPSAPDAIGLSVGTPAAWAACKRPAAPSWTVRMEATG